MRSGFGVLRGGKRKISFWGKFERAWKKSGEGKILTDYDPML